MKRLEELRGLLRDLFGSQPKKMSQVGIARETGIDQATLSRFRKSGGLSRENFISLDAWAVQKGFLSEHSRKEEVEDNSERDNAQSSRIRVLEEKISAQEREIELQNEVNALLKEKIEALSKYGPAVLPASSVKITEHLPGRESALFLDAVGIDPRDFSEYPPDEKVDFLLRVIRDNLAKCPEFGSTCLYFGIEQLLIANIPYNEELQATLDKVSEVRRGAILKIRQNPHPPNDCQPNGGNAGGISGESPKKGMYKNRLSYSYKQPLPSGDLSPKPGGQAA